MTILKITFANLQGSKLKVLLMFVTSLKQIGRSFAIMTCDKKCNTCNPETSKNNPDCKRKIKPDMMKFCPDCNFELTKNEINSKLVFAENVGGLTQKGDN
jgi:hypothetical protein